MSAFNAAPTVAESKAALVAFVDLHIPGMNVRLELSKLTADYVDASVRAAEEKNARAGALRPIAGGSR